MKLFVVTFHKNVFSFSFFSGALPFVTASVFCLGGFLKWLTIISYSILCLWGLQKALTAGSPWQRRLCFALPFLMRVLLTILRISRFGGGNPTAMIHVFLQVRYETLFLVMFGKIKEIDCPYNVPHETRCHLFFVVMRNSCRANWGRIVLLVMTLSIVC